MTHSVDRKRLGGIGVWQAGFRLGEASEIAEGVKELEELGYTAAWVPGIAGPGTVAACEPLLAATERMTVNTGVVNIWADEPGNVASEFARLNVGYGGRTLVGLGISHAPAVGERYRRPLSKMNDYLDALDGNDPPLGSQDRVLAAIGPKMLEVARERSVGSHPYLMPPKHTAMAREALGDDALLCPEQTVVLETDPEKAREVARKWFSVYSQLPNYTNNLRRVLELSDEDFADGFSDRLIDAAVAWGDEAAIRKRVDEHFDAGADHVCVQVIASAKDLPLDSLRRLAPALID
jgi:probable F420-dependent oxidoreductase